MIRIATEEDFQHPADDERAIRIHSLKCAYGLDVPFIRYYADDRGGLLSLMDGTAVLYCPELTDEWLLFIHMNPDITHIHCSIGCARRLQAGGWRGREGVVLRYEGDRHDSPLETCNNPYLPAVYELLSVCFEELPPLNAWYPDVSHRIRHNCSKIACILCDDKVISTAMTVAETETAALLGQVATHPDFRGMGYAKTCINSLISICKVKELYILPKNEFARSLYESMGFVACGEWAELSRL